MDTFANQACITVTESAANTLTFQKLETGISIGARQAWIIHRLEYFFDSLSTLNGTTDVLQMGISQSNSWTAVSAAEPSILDICWFERLDFGTAATGLISFKPLIKDFGALPGGGLLIVPNPLYAFAKGTGCAALTSSKVRVYYTQIDVKDAEFYELWQSRVLLTA